MQRPFKTMANSIMPKFLSKLTWSDEEDYEEILDFNVTSNYLMLLAR